jgi:hypothetical protein
MAWETGRSVYTINGRYLLIAIILGGLFASAKTSSK